MTSPELREKLWEARLALREIITKTDGEVPRWILARRNVHQALERIGEALKYAESDKGKSATQMVAEYQERRALSWREEEQ